MCAGPLPSAGTRTGGWRVLSHGSGSHAGAASPTARIRCLPGAVATRRPAPRVPRRAVIRKRRAQARFERPLELASELQETGIPFPVVAHPGETLIVQLVAAVERQLQVLVGQHLVCADGRNPEEARRTREGLDHRVAHRTPGGRKLRPGAAIAPTSRIPRQPSRAGRRDEQGSSATPTSALDSLGLRLSRRHRNAACVHHYRPSLVQSGSASGPASVETGGPGPNRGVPDEGPHKLTRSGD